MKLNYFLAFAFIFAVSCATIGSAWTSSEFIKDQTKIDEKSLELSKVIITNYGKYEIKESQWWDIAKIFTEEKVKEVTLKENTEECSDNCFAIKEVINLKSMPLIEDVRFYREIDGKWILWNGFTNWKIEVEEDVDLFETQCIDGKTIFNEKNGTSYTEKICEQVKIGTEKQWLPLDYKKDYEGTYRIKLSGGKKASVKYDWQVKMNGVWSEEWAVWGAVIGVGGVEASVTLNSPAEGSIQYSNPVTFNASANVTNGAYLVNATLYDNSTGSWGARNTTDINLAGDDLVSYYKLDETSGTVAIDSLNVNNATNQGTALVNQAGKIGTSYNFTGTNNLLANSNIGIIGTMPRTINMWLRFPSTATVVSDQTIWVYGSGVTSKLFGLRIPSGTNQIWTELYGTDFNTGFTKHADWKMYTMKYNGTHVSVQQNAGTATTSAVTLATTDAQLRIGDNYDGGSHGVFSADEISIWNRSLTASEITTLYNSGAGSRPATTTTTTTFTNTYPAGDVIDWNMKFCDSDGDCGFATSNRTFSIDSTAPTITLNYPTSLINYGKMNGTLQLNFTVTDTNLDKVWYNYNGTNVSVNGALSGIANLSNITLIEGDKNITIYANDTAGNLKTSIFSWDYKIFENGQTYINSTYANVKNPFTLNITSPNVSSVILNYNNTNYSTNSYLSGSNYISSVSVISPLVSQNTNVSFSWLVTLLDGSIIQTDVKNQTIIYLTVGNTYSNLIYNLSFRDEFTNAIINNSLITTSYEVTYGFNNLSILGTNNFNGANLSNVNISSNIFSSLYLSGNIIYSATGYIGRTYKFVEDSINTSKNVTLYLSNANSSYVKSILVTDEAGRGVPATFKQYAIISGVKQLVASEQLDTTGKSTIVFTPNIQYTFEFTTTGCSDLSKNIIFYDQSDYVQTLSCSSYNPDDYLDPFENMFVSFSPSGVFTVDNTTVDDDSTFYVNVSGNAAFCANIDAISFNVYDELNNLIVSDSGSNCDVLTGSGLFNLFAIGRLYILLDSGETKELSYHWQKIYSDADYSDYNILTLLSEVGNSDDILGIDWKFKLLFSFIGLFGIIIALTVYQRIYNFSNLPILIVADAYIWFMSFIGWFNLSFGSTSGGFTSLISQYALLVLSIIGTAAIISTKEDDYS